VWDNQNRANCLVLHLIYHPLRHSNYTDTGVSTRMLRMQPLTISPRMHIYQLPVNPEAEGIWSSMPSDVSKFRFR
jgi:hypothetical protein